VPPGLGDDLSRGGELRPAQLRPTQLGHDAVAQTEMHLEYSPALQVVDNKAEGGNGRLVGKVDATQLSCQSSEPRRAAAPIHPLDNLSFAHAPDARAPGWISGMPFGPSK
jgi:hypothetical protein